MSCRLKDKANDPHGRHPRSCHDCGLGPCKIGFGAPAQRVPCPYCNAGLNSDTTMEACDYCGHTGFVTYGKPIPTPPAPEQPPKGAMLIQASFDAGWDAAVDAFKLRYGELSKIDYFAKLVSRARVEADKAITKFPQPNYVLLKVAEEAGEVVKAAVHCAEQRGSWAEVEGETVQLLAMLIRLMTEGDQTIKLTPGLLS